MQIFAKISGAESMQTLFACCYSPSKALTLCLVLLGTWERMKAYLWSLRGTGLGSMIN